jgi:hypothetical protein
LSGGTALRITLEVVSPILWQFGQRNTWLMTSVPTRVDRLHLISTWQLGQIGGSISSSARLSLSTTESYLPFSCLLFPNPSPSSSHQKQKGPTTGAEALRAQVAPGALPFNPGPSIGSPHTHNLRQTAVGDCVYADCAPKRMQIPDRENLAILKEPTVSKAR